MTRGTSQGYVYTLPCRIKKSIKQKQVMDLNCMGWKDGGSITSNINFLLTPVITFKHEGISIKVWFRK